MKKLFVLVVCLVITGGLIISCGDKTTSDNSVPLNEFNKTATLQGTILDATTGVRIGGLDLDVTLIQGSNHRNPSRLITDVTNPLVGEFAFNSVPIALFDGDITYKIVVTNTGYQRFEGEFTMTAADHDETVDGTYNFIGNIYLYPTGATAGDIVINVESGATWDATTGDNRVPDATVQLEQDIENNLTVNGTTSRLLPSTGLLPVLTATTDADGVATFSGADLVLGGKYNPVVLPVTFNATSLAITAGVSIFVGTDVDSQTITMADVTVDPLEIVSATNKDPDSITATGVLVLIFNRPVTLVDAASTVDAAILCGGGACPNATLDADSATAVISNGGYTLTITPNFTTGFEPDVALGDTSGVVSYSNVTVTLDNVNAIDVFTLDCTDGTPVSADVNVTGLQ